MIGEQMQLQTGNGKDIINLEKKNSNL